MSNENQGIPVIRAGRGKFIPNLSPDSFFESFYGSLHEFAVTIADGDMALGENLDHEREIVVELLNQFEEAGVDITEIDLELQARYHTVLADCLKKFCMIVQSSTLLGYKGLDENKPRIISPF